MILLVVRPRSWKELEGAGRSWIVGVLVVDSVQYIFRCYSHVFAIGIVQE